MSFSGPKVIVVGGGLSGCSAAHTILERGGKVLLLDKNPFLGGNSVKATSGINAALTRSQIRLGIKDSIEAFEKDTALSATKKESDVPSPLNTVLCTESAPAVEWLINKFGLDLTVVSRLGGQTFPRTHRGAERFPGFVITYTLMEKLQELAKKTPELVTIRPNCRVTKLIQNSKGEVTGVEYETKGKKFTEDGVVVLATGGYGADFSEGSILAKYRPDLLKFSTTNGDHCTGDGHKMSMAIGADCVHMEFVQVHPTGLVHPDDPNSKVKFLAAEALRGVGGIVVNGDGKRFVNELATRDYVSGVMLQNKPPFRLILNSASSKEILWHCKHYAARGLMRKLTGAELAKEIGCSYKTLKDTMDTYTKDAMAEKCPFGRLYFQSLPYTMDDSFYVAIITPVVHYCNGGIRIDTTGNICDKNNKPFPGLYACGETTGGVHGKNRLGGSSLLDCVVFGRVSGSSAAKYLFSKLSSGNVVSGGSQDFGIHFGKTHIKVDSKQQKVTLSFNGEEQPTTTTTTTKPIEGGDLQSPPEFSENNGGVQQKSSSPPMKIISRAEVAKHNKREDCWVIVGDLVLNVTKFLPNHPGGIPALLLFAGKDATEEFGMIHPPGVIEEYAPYAKIGFVEGSQSAIEYQSKGGQIKSNL